MLHNKISLSHVSFMIDFWINDVVNKIDNLAQSTQISFWGPSQ